MRRSRSAAVAIMGVLLTGCGAGTSADDPSTASEAAAPYVVTNGEVMVSCGDDEAGWPSSVLSEGVPGVLDDAAAVRIFDEILDDPMWGEEAALGLFPGGAQTDWRVLRAGDNTLTIGLGNWTEQGPRGKDSRILELRRDGESWQPVGWGNCRLSPVLKEGNSWVEMTAYEGDSSARLVAQVSERACASSRDPEPFLHEPLVVETEETVTIYWTSDTPEGNQDCAGNPSIDRVVQLEEPLGDRVVLDGSSYPPQEVRAH